MFDSKSIPEAVVWVVGWLCVAAVCLGLFWAFLTGSMESGDEDTARMQSCVSAGGQWIRGDCVKGAAG